MKAEETLYEAVLGVPELKNAMYLQYTEAAIKMIFENVSMDFIVSLQRLHAQIDASRIWVTNSKKQAEEASG